MLSIEKYFVPSNTLLQTYLQNGAYGDCYWTDISRGVSFPEFILAFYTTPLFKIERSILPWTVSKPSTDNQARQLSTGASEIFAAWHVENRSENEILMCDFHGRTRSWLKVAPVDDARTRLYFGSAVIPSRNPRTGARSPDLYFKYYWDFIKST